MTCDPVLAMHSHPSLFQAYCKTLTVERNGAPGGARVVGHATRTSVTTRSRFGRGARHRSIRLREPPASGALASRRSTDNNTKAFVRQIGRGRRRIFKSESNKPSYLIQ
jgi:hypothetical protein